MILDDTLSHTFTCHFKIVYANTPQLKHEVFKIRHSVYCEELGWEEKNQDYLEKDEYDDFSHHLLIQHKKTNTFIGCVRLVSPQFLALEQSLPCELFYPQEDMAKALNQSVYFSSGYGEVSRLAILSSFRRRKKDNESEQLNRVFNFQDKESLRTFPLISVGLYLGVIACAELLENRGLFLVATSSLSKKLTRLGAPIAPILTPIEHRGKRQLNYLKAQQVQECLIGGSADLYHHIKDDISCQMSMVKREKLEIA